MFWTIAVLLMVLWTLGMNVGAGALGWWVHILLAMALFSTILAVTNHRRAFSQ